MTYRNEDNSEITNLKKPCSEATGTVGRVADKGREREAGRAER